MSKGPTTETVSATVNSQAQALVQELGPHIQRMIDRQWDEIKNCIYQRNPSLPSTDGKISALTIQFILTEKHLQYAYNGKPAKHLRIRKGHRQVHFLLEHSPRKYGPIELENQVFPPLPTDGVRTSAKYCSGLEQGEQDEESEDYANADSERSEPNGVPVDSKITRVELKRIRKGLKLKKAELAKAKNDPNKQEILREDIVQIEKFIKDVSFNNKPKPSTNSMEKARLRVRKTIAEAIDEILLHDLDLGAHLRAFIRYRHGEFLYEPPPHPIQWRL